jgi:hypothetical protein
MATVSVERTVQLELAGETEMLRENLLQRQSVHPSGTGGVSCETKHHNPPPLMGRLVALVARILKGREVSADNNADFRGATP